MGTPEIAAEMLRAVATEHTVCGVVCQPDKPVGRKAVITPPPVKVAAEALGLPVYQPVKLRDGAAAQTLAAWQPDLAVVVAYGRLLPKELLDIPRLGCLNIHVSLLPKYRGAAPIQHALLNGETETGVTAMFLDEGLDTGDIAAVRRFPIAPEDDAGDLFARAAKEGAALLLEVLAQIERGAVTRTKQDDAQASFAPPVDAKTGQFAFTEDAADIVNKVRALALWPNASFVQDGRKVKVKKARVAEGGGEPGAVLSLHPLTVAAGSGAVILETVCPEGKKEMSGTSFAAGLRLRCGDFIE